jgi:N-acyl-D-amino-acid deacylase
MHDLVIKDAQIVDGSGAPAFVGDVAIDGDRIVAVGTVDTPARREVAGEGRLLTPGWVDIHSHYDGQVTWDPYLSPSSWHGCTTVVMGNCGVGFAPVRPDDRQTLVRLMEGVEDIPEIVLAEGLKWNWESFPDFLDAVDAMPRAIDVGIQVAHAPLRVFAMGERGVMNQAATAADIEQMRQILREALAAGAIGFSTSRFLGHRALSGALVPGTFANDHEIAGILQAFVDEDMGFFQFVAGSGIPQASFFDTAFRYSREHKIPMGMNLQQVNEAPDGYRDILRRLEREHAAGGEVYGLVHGRTTGILMCLESTIMPFMDRPSYQSIADLPLAERVRRMRDPAVRAAILSERPAPEGFLATVSEDLPDCYDLGDPPEYEPGPERGFGAIAGQSGRGVEELAYDVLLQRGGKGIIYYPTMNYSHGDLDATLEMMEHPFCRLGLADGGAHCGVICDVSLPTFLLTHWARDRKRGRKLSIERAVQIQTGDTASVYGLHDRGLLKPGYKADLNLIDFDNLRLHVPEIAYDLPAGGRRFVQKASGYDMTICSGVPIFERGEATGALPGRLIRGRPRRH